MSQNQLRPGRGPCFWGPCRQASGQESRHSAGQGVLTSLLCLSLLIVIIEVNFTNIKLTIFRCPIQAHLVGSQCAASTSAGPECSQAPKAYPVPANSFLNGAECGHSTAAPRCPCIAPRVGPGALVS